MRRLRPRFPLPLALALLLIGVGAGAHAETPSPTVDGGPDLIREALARLGLDRDDLGYRPRSSWTRFPLPSTIPHLNPAFDDLFARPLATPRFIHGLADPVRRYLAPDNLAENADALYQLTYFLAVEKFAPGFRSYSANAVVELDPETPLKGAFTRLEREAGDGPRAHSFGSRYDRPEEHPDRELHEAIDALDPALRPILAELVLGLAEAARWSRLSFRLADRELLEAVLALGSGDLRESETYHPEVDDLARLWDRQSLAYGALKTAQHLDDARLALLALPESARRGKGVLLDASTPLGRVVVSGTDRGEHDADGCLLWLDLGGVRVVHACWSDHDVSIVREAKSVLDLHRSAHEKIRAEARDSGLKAESDRLKARWESQLKDDQIQMHYLEPLATYQVKLQVENPVKVLSSGLEEALGAGADPYHVGGKWRMTTRTPWWQAYRCPVPVVFGHYWRKPDQSRGEPDTPDLFPDLQREPWLGPLRNCLCIDLSVGRRYRERSTGAVPRPSIGTLAALRVPEWTLFMDDRPAVQLPSPAA